MILLGIKGNQILTLIISQIQLVKKLLINSVPSKVQKNEKFEKELDKLNKIMKLRPVKSC